MNSPRTSEPTSLRETTLSLPTAVLRRRVERLFADADVCIGGGRPWDIQIHDESLYLRLLTQGSLALGESYMDGDWDAASLDGLMYHLIDARLDERKPGLSAVWDTLHARLVNLQAGRRSFAVGERHYDLGNDLYRAMLGPRMIYSCAYWRGPQGAVAFDLDTAQEAKLHLVFRKLGLSRGQRVLDVGCGWGGALKFAAERYGITGVGVTVSRQQADYAREQCAGLPIEIRLQDYRELDEPFDRVFSLGMFEHVGMRNYRRYFEVVRRCLPDDGLFLLHSIGGDQPTRSIDPWINRYIFPNSMLPSHGSP